MMLCERCNKNPVIPRGNMQPDYCNACQGVIWVYESVEMHGIYTISKEAVLKYWKNESDFNQWVSDNEMVVRSICRGWDGFEIKKASAATEAK